MLPRVREIEERFADCLTGIGIHAGKFPGERRTDRIAQACDRLSVTHAVVNDRQFRIWREFAVNAWPTVVVIDPQGYIALTVPGEFDVEVMSQHIAQIAHDAEKAGTLVRGPDPVSVNVPRGGDTLRYPTRAALLDGSLWIADTGNGRVLECAWERGADDAEVVREYAGFVEPRGLASVSGDVYAADRAGHAVWRLEAGGDPELVAGTGRMGRYSIMPGDALRADLRSPWGLAPTGDGRLAIAMAGTHQLWALDVRGGRIEPLAGTGAEAIVDGPAAESVLAQPTGVSAGPDGGLAFADCESSAVRVLRDGAVRTLVGTGLFDFGDRAGVGDDALLEHCEDVAVHGDVLAVADTYNDRLKLVDPVTRECVPWPGEAGEKGALREPGGVWSDGTTLLVADTGNHRVVRVDGDGGVREVRILPRG